MPLPQLSIRKQRIKSSLEEGFLEIKVMKYQKRSSKLSLKVKEKKKKKLEKSCLFFEPHTALLWVYSWFCVREANVVLGMEPRSVTCKAKSALLTILSLEPKKCLKKYPF